MYTIHGLGCGDCPMIHSISLANVHMHALSILHMHSTTIILIMHYYLCTLKDIYIAAFPLM